MKDHIFKTEYCDHGINPEIKYRTKSIDKPDNIEIYQKDSPMADF